MAGMVLAAPLVSAAADGATPVAAGSFTVDVSQRL
jgi:hypothetical protein